MADWKQVERKIAAVIGGERVPVTGRQRGSAPDISHEILAVEVKHRKKLPAFYGELMRAAELFGYDAVEFWSGASETKVLLRLRTLQSIITDNFRARRVVALNECDEYALLFDALDQATKSAQQLKKSPTDVRCPVVFLHEDKMKIENTFVIFPKASFDSFLASLDVKRLRKGKTAQSEAALAGCAA